MKKRILYRTGSYRGSFRRLGFAAAMFLLMVPLFAVTSCVKDPELGVIEGVTTRAAMRGETMGLVTTSGHNLSVTTTGTKQYRLETTGADSYVSATPLTSALASTTTVLTFQYRSSSTINGAQIYFSNPVAENRSVQGLTIPAASDWTEWSIELSSQISAFGWGASGHYVRLDFGNDTGISIDIRDLHFREPMAGENETLGLDLSTAKGMNASQTGTNQFRMVSTNTDPYIYTTRLTRELPTNSYMLKFRYKLSAPINNLQIFFADDLLESRSVHGLIIPAATEWTEWSVDLSDYVWQFDWGDAGDYLRLDIGDVSGVTMDVADIHFEGPEQEMFDITAASANQLSVTRTGVHSYDITTTGGDPFVYTTRLAQANPADASVLTFEYIASSSFSDVQVFLADPISEARSVRGLSIPASQQWATWSAPLTSMINSLNWGVAGNYLRLDFGMASGKSIKIRNIHLRPLTPDEQLTLDKESRLIATLGQYLSEDYASTVSQVNVGMNNVTISGNYSGSGSFSLAEITPYQDVTAESSFAYKTPLTSSSFNVQLDRYVTRDGIEYDRALSKWAVVKVGSTSDELVSHARYADAVYSTQSLPNLPLLGKKGLGGYFNHSTQTQDLTDMGITSVTVNVPISGYMFSQNGGNRIAHTYGGKTYYFDNGAITGLDAMIKNATDRNILVAAIILIQPAASCADPVLGNLFQHPNYVSGPYTMPNMTNAESMNTYAAALDFLASRYCRTDNQYGRISKWIMHNEVDAGIEWTNMGSKPMILYTDSYVKSMRMCSNIARQYDQYAEILGSFTHSWTAISVAGGFPGRDMINTVNDFSQAEGDYRWGLAYHSYPQDLTEPKTWLDNGATFDTNTSFVTFKNLEVLDNWAKQTANKYQGTTKRSIWLSENGTNSRSYSTSDLAAQAAGAAYALKKIKQLDGIDAIQWHNWFDNPAEVGLHIGLRNSDLQAKPVWNVYQAAWTSQEDAVFNQYMGLIGISNWNQIMHTLSF